MVPPVKPTLQYTPHFGKTLSAEEPHCREAKFVGSPDNRALEIESCQTGRCGQRVEATCVVRIWG